MNKQEVENLIDKLADKTLSFGCEYEDRSGFIRILRSECGKGKLIDIYEKISFKSTSKILGHPIRIGNVLEKIPSIKRKYTAKVFKKGLAESVGCFPYTKTIELWQPCGFTKSLQDIAQEDTKEGDTLLEFINNILNEKN